MQAALRHVSPFSGSWYPSDPAELRGLLDGLFAESEQRTGRFMPSRAAGFVVPHAGLVYSGRVAAAAYSRIGALAPSTVVLLGFAHHGAAPGAWIPDIDAYETPLGEVAVDRELAAELTAQAPFRRGSEAGLCDHSVEIQLPLLQASAPAARVLPVYVSGLSPAARATAARALAGLVARGAVLVASSDFTHYGRGFSYQPFPADERVAERLSDLDGTVIDAAGTLSPDEFRHVLSATGATVCGHEPIGLLLETVTGLEEEVFQELLDYQTSGEITGDFRQSVSYAALGYFPYRAFELCLEDQQALLESARRTLARFLETGERRSVRPERDSPGLDRRAAAFVTLHSEGALRGCVGRRVSNEPLHSLVPSLTLSAALDDSRFDPVCPGESGLDLEISVLSPMKRILDPERLRAGEHGAMLDAGDYHGLLLPQVASERNWGTREFLDALARKSGVRPSVYHDPSTRISVFRAQIIR